MRKLRQTRACLKKQAKEMQKLIFVLNVNNFQTFVATLRLID